MKYKVHLRNMMNWNMHYLPGYYDWNIKLYKQILGQEWSPTKEHNYMMPFSEFINALEKQIWRDDLKATIEDYLNNDDVKAISCLELYKKLLPYKIRSIKNDEPMHLLFTEIGTDQIGRAHV